MNTSMFPDHRDPSDSGAGEADQVLKMAKLPRDLVSTTPSEFTTLEQNLGYAFCNRSLLDQALTHRSVTADRTRNYERLEFFGDRLIETCLVHILLEKDRFADENVLNRRLIDMTTRTAFAHVAGKIALASHIRFGGNSALTNRTPRNQEKIVADVLEAVVAAVYLDSNFQETLNVVRRLFEKA